MQRHFVSHAIGFPSPTSIMTIFQTFLDGHFAMFDEEVRVLASPIINGALALHTAVATTFRKTAKNFHYEFSLRHLARVVQVSAMPPRTPSSAVAPPHTLLCFALAGVAARTTWPVP